MEHFVIFNPVKVYFGEGVVEKSGEVAALTGKKALIVTGKGSARTNGSYDQTVNSLTNAGIEVVDYSGIRPNPIVEDVEQAAALGRKEHVDMVVGIGGGSVIDSAKFIALTIPAKHPCWDFVTGSKKPAKALPVLSVLTLAATGSEMNATAVVQDNKEKMKKGFSHPLLYPKYSFLDPSFTRSVPANHTAYGITDLIAHALEGWFGEGDATLTDKFIVSIIREAMEYGPQLMQDLENYTLRAKIMYAATMALNGLTAQAKKSGDWGVHGISHCISVLWDIPHGASLSITYPAWLKLHKNRIPERIKTLGSQLFDTPDVDETIRHLKNFFKQLPCPVSLSETKAEVNEKNRQELLRVMQINKPSGLHHKLSADDYRFLVNEVMNEPM